MISQSEKTNPKQTQFKKRVKLMQSVYLQRIMKKNADMGYEKTNPIQTQSERPKMNAFAWVRSVTIVFCDSLAVFTTLKGVKISFCMYGNRGAFWFCRNNPGDISLRARTYRPALSESLHRNPFD